MSLRTVTPHRIRYGRSTYGFIAALKAATLTALSWRENAKHTQTTVTGLGPATRSDILSAAKRSLGLWDLAPSTVRAGESFPHPQPQQLAKGS
jgi:hypothetical protein